MNIYKTFSFLFGVPSAFLGILFLSSGLSSEYPNYLKEIEVTISDAYSDASEREETLKILLDDLDSNSKIKYLDKTSSNKTYKNISQAPDSDKEKYLKLSELSRNFVKLQHSLNNIKASYWRKKAKETSETFGLDLSKCCASTGSGCSCKCCTAGQSQNCCKDNKCLCLCCYLCSSNSQSQCCCSSQTSGCTDIANNNKNFWYHLSNLNSSSANVYLSPVKAHIRLLDSDFNKDLKVQDSKSTFKKMIGTLTYGFVDYGWKEVSNTDTSFLSRISSSSSSSSSSTGKKYYSNLPLSLDFSFSSDSDKNLVKILDKLSDKSQMSNYIDKAVSGSCCLCCLDTENNTNDIECLLKRSYVIATDTFTDIKLKINKISGKPDSTQQVLSYDIPM